MKVDRTTQTAHGFRFSITYGTREVARAFLYVLWNDLHSAPFGLLEDVFVDESKRGQGLGTELIAEVLAAARDVGCYKIIATSRMTRPRVHELYERLGFHKHGVEFRMDIEDSHDKPIDRPLAI